MDGENEVTKKNRVSISMKSKWGCRLSMEEDVLICIAETSWSLWSQVRNTPGGGLATMITQWSAFKQQKTWKIGLRWNPTEKSVETDSMGWGRTDSSNCRRFSSILGVFRLRLRNWYLYIQRSERASFPKAYIYYGFSFL